MPEISVVIPTRNRAALLEPCLISLLQQTIAPEKYEICVVDNASTDDTQKIVAKLAAQYPRHKLFSVIESRPGVTFARNRGITATTAALIACGDDDITVPPDWLERYLARFATLAPTTVKIGGEIEPIWGAPRPPWLSEAMTCLLSAHSSIKSDSARVCTGSEILIECNCCYRRDALERMGGFPTAFGRRDSHLLSGDNAVDYRMMAQGLGFFYDPDIMIKHHIHAERLTLPWFRRRYFWQGVTDFAVRGYLEQHGVAIPQSHTIGVPLSQADWTALHQDATDNLDERLRHIRGIGFFMAMIGAIGEL